MLRIGIVTTATLLGATLLAMGPAFAAKGGNGGGGGGGGGGGATPVAPVIAWTQYEGNAWNVKVMDADGANQAAVVRNVGTSFADPAWSPDGNELVFSVSGRLQGTGVYRAPVDGSAAPVRIVATGTSVSAPDWSPAAAPDGNAWIVFQDYKPGGAATDLYVVSPSGGTSVNLTGSLGGSFSFACWSGDASRIAAAWTHGGRNDLAVLSLGTDASGALVVDAVANLTDVAGSPLRSLADGAVAADQDYDASWGRTADTLIVSVLEVVGGKDNHDLWEIDIAAPASPVRLTQTTDSVDGSHTLGERHPSYAPDDAAAVFWLRGKGKTGSGIFTLALGGASAGTRTSLVVAEDVRNPSWFRGN